MNCINEALVKKEVDEMLIMLSKPLSNAELANGWSVDCQKAMFKLFDDIKKRLELSQDHPPLFIARGLDQWGVTRGEMLEKAAKISNMIRELR